MSDWNESPDSSERPGPEEAAIIGMACIFPKAPDLKTYWQNIVSKVDAIDDPPDGSLLHQVYDPGSTDNDRIYCKRGGYLPGTLPFNPYEFGIMPVAVDGAMPEQFIALKVANDALLDAGLFQKPFNRERTETIIGRGTFVNRGYFTLLQHGFIVDQTIRILREMHPEHSAEDLAAVKQKLKATLPPFSGETAPGLVDSIVAGIIANRLNLKGRNLAVDAACASVLIALEIGLQHLLEKRCDVVLIGGIQISTPHLIHLLFTQLGALTRQQELRPFDKDADGTMLGEGVGMMVLKRREDAIRDGHRIYAVVKGVGSSSDGRGKGLVAPQIDGQTLALKRAYEASRVSPDSIELIEAHGTGLPLGDSTEIQSMQAVFGARATKLPRCALGSVKSMIGHLLPASGIAGIIKTALALHHKILPPMLHCDQPNPKFELEKTPFYINPDTRPWIHGNRGAPRRAGVNAFGFGGINTHAVLEEFIPGEGEKAAFYHTAWDCELCLFRGKSRQELVQQCRKVLGFLAVARDLSLVDLAFTLNTEGDPGLEPCLALVASSVEDLQKKLSHATRELEDPRRTRLKERSGIYFFEQQLGAQGKLAFVFPGEGSQYVNMLSDLCLHFPEVRVCFDLLDQAYADQPEHDLPSQSIYPPGAASVTGAEGKILQMDGAVDAVITGDRAIYRLLTGLGIKADAMVGHSSGEIMALEASGSIELDSEQELIEHIRAGNRMIRSLLASDNIPHRVLTAVGGLDYETICQSIVASGATIWISMENCPNQVILCGDGDDIEKLTHGLRQKGGICQPLPFGRAYHTPLFEPVLKPLKEFFGRLKMVSPHTPLYSCMTEARFPENPEEIRRTAVAQWAAPVRFQKTIETMHRDGVRIFLEIGPGGNLTGFINDILKKKEFLALASNVRLRSGIGQLNHTLGLLAAHGVAMCLEPLYKRRNPKKLSLDPAQPMAPVKEPKKETITLSLSLPKLGLGASCVKQRGVPDSTALKTSEPLTAKAIPAFHRVATPATESVFADSNSHAARLTAGAASGQAMEAYLRTMESFLDVQEEVMLSYLGSAETVGSHAVVEGHSQQEGAPSPSGYAKEPAAAMLKGPVHCPSVAEGKAPEKNISEDKASPTEASRRLSHDKAAIERLLISIVSEKTGYPVDMLNLDHNLEAELGIDSIKRVEILGALYQKIGKPEQTEAERVSALKTLRQIADVLNARKVDRSDGPAQGGNGGASPAVTCDLTEHPLAGRIVHLSPGREVTALQTIHIEEQLFLRDHTLGGRVSKEDETLPALPVVPFSMSVEAMAAVAARLAPGKVLIAIRNVRAHHWLALEEESLTLRIHGAVSPAATGEIETALWIQASGKNGGEDRLAAEATLVFADTYPQPPGREPFLLRESASPLSADRFYPEALFHGPAFQTVKRLLQCGPDGAVAILAQPSADALFRDKADPRLLSAPFLTDGAGQVVGLWAGSLIESDFVVFPVGVKEIRYYGPSLPAGSAITCQVRTDLEDGLIRSQADLFDAHGALCIQLAGLDHKRIRMPRLIHLFRGSRDVMLSLPWPAPTHGCQGLRGVTCCRLDAIPIDFWEADACIWRTVVAFIVLGRKERETWRTLPGSESRRTEWLLGKAAAKEAVRMLLKDRHGLNVWPADIEIDTDRDGRAIVSGKWAHVIGGPPLVSVSHSQGVVAAAAADRSSYKGIGIDIEVLRATGNGLDDLAFCQEELTLIKQFSCEDADAWRLRLWCAKESVAKSTGKGLLGLPKAIRADRIDPQTGDLQLVLSESYAAVSGTVAGQRIRAHSFQDSNLIGSIAAIPADEPGRCAAEPEASRCIKVSEASRMPFLGEILSHVPGDRISASRLFNLEEDLFLLDHALGRNISICDPELKGLPVMPLTVSLEMMAEAATLLRPQMLLVGMRDIRASRWLAFDRRQITIRIEATCPHSREVRVKLWDDATAVPTAPAVEGTIVFAHAYPTPAASGEFNLTHQRPSIWSPEALYTEGMFHGPLFRGVTSVDAWGENGLTATLRSEPATGFFRSTVAHRFILDPVLMDAAGQLVAYWFVEEHQDIGFNTYPYRIDAIRFYGPSIAPPAKVEGRVRIQTVTAGKLKADIQVLDTNGKVRMEFVGWEDRPIRLPSPFYRARFKPAAAFLSEACPKWVERLPSQLSLECCRMDAYDNHLLDAHGGIWLQVLGHLALSSAERQAWNTLSSRGVPEIDWLLARIAGKDAARRLFKAKYGLLLCMADIEIDSAGRCCIVKGSRRDAIPTTPTVSVACADKIGVALAVEKIERCGIAVMCLSTFNGKENRFKFADEERRLCVQAGIGRCSEWTPIIACAKQAAEKAIGPRNDVGDTLKLSGLDPKEGIIEFTADGSSFGGSLGPFSQRFRVCIIREADLAVCIAFVPGEFAEKGDGR